MANYLCFHRDSRFFPKFSTAILCFHRDSRFVRSVFLLRPQAMAFFVGGSVSRRTVPCTGGGAFGREGRASPTVTTAGGRLAVPCSGGGASLREGRASPTLTTVGDPSADGPSPPGAASRLAHSRQWVGVSGSVAAQFCPRAVTPCTASTYKASLSRSSCQGITPIRR
jgi:hypothetical protein